MIDAENTDELPEVLTNSTPVMPTAEERSAHEQTRRPFRVWCGARVQAQKRDEPRRRVQYEES